MHEFIIHAMQQRARTDNLTVCYRKKQMEGSFSCMCPVIDNEFRHNIGIHEAISLVMVDSINSQELKMVFLRKENKII